MTIRIEIGNPVWSKASDQESRDFIKPILSFEAEYWAPGKYSKARHTYTKSMMKRNGKFLTGLIPRIKEIVERKGKELELLFKSTWFDEIKIIRKEMLQPKVNGITFHDFQKELILKTRSDRGVIKAPARSGKTVIAGGIISQFPHSNSLFLCHTKDLLGQTEEEFLKFGFSVGVIGDGRKEVDQKVTVATHQSMVNIIENFDEDRWDVVIVDECHHVSKEDGNYAKILKRIRAPWRIGFTATISKKPSEFMAMEGLIGPIIGELTPEQAVKEGIIAKPKINIVQVPQNTAIKKMSYVQAYKVGVIRNRARNRLIMKTANDYLEEDFTVLILVTRVLHGFKIQEMFEKFSTYEAPFICSNIDADTQKEIKRMEKKIEDLAGTSQGKGSKAIEILKEDLEELLELRTKVRETSKLRKSYRHALNEGKIRCVIATNIWNEGINIPNLNVVINAAGGKSEKATIQVASRSMTKVPGKDYGIIVDLFDRSHTFMIEHFGERLCLYMEEGWL